MMRRLPLLAGMLVIALLPRAASARVNCDDLAGAPAISQHYVQIALDRAHEGIVYASSARTNTDFFSFYLPGWARSVAGSFAYIVNAQQQTAARATDLAKTTACLRYDQLLIECKMYDVQVALDRELERGSFIAIMRLQSDLLFLQERMTHLNKGAADGSYADERWEKQWLFEEQPPAELTEPLCPFHSDYTPPRSTGYGCDVEVLGRIGGSGIGFVDAEREALATIEREIDRFREIVPLLESVGEYVPGGGVAPLPITGREHRTLIGCQEEVGACSGDGSLACGSDEFCASRGAGRCDRANEDLRIPKRSIRGPFSYPPAQLELLTDFIEKRVEDGFSRTYAEGWARTEDLPEGSAVRDARESDIPLQTMGRATLRTFFRSVSGIQGQREGLSFPEATDGQLEIAESLSDMRESIGELSRLASTREGLRSFIVEFAYFLRRTCTFRPCQRMLEQVIRIGLEDECFPYTDGEFLGDSADDPRWKKCAEAACVQVDGVALDSDCREILP